MSFWIMVSGIIRAVTTLPRKPKAIAAAIANISMPPMRIIIVLILVSPFFLDEIVLCAGICIT